VRRLPINSGSYGENLPDGAYAVVTGSGVQTHQGVIPYALEGQPLYLRMSNTPSLQFAGQASTGGGTLVWNGAWVRDPRIAHGISGCIFDRDGILRIIEPAANQTSQGYRYVADDGSLVLGDATYGDATLRISEYTTHGDVTIGQGWQGGCLAIRGSLRVLLETGDCRFVRFSRAGDSLAVTIVKFAENQTILLWLDVAELSLFQPEPSTTPFPLPVPVPVPVPLPEPTLMYANYESYLARRWEELRVRERSEVVAAEHGYLSAQQLNNDYNANVPAALALVAEKLTPLQAGAFVQMLGELHHAGGHKDVGAGAKLTGNNYQGMATDIVILKPIDAQGRVVADGPVQMVDAVSSLGGLESHITWGIGETNPARTFVVPPVPSGAPVPVPQPTPVPVPVPQPPVDLGPILARLSALDVELRQLNSDLATARDRITALEQKPPPQMPTKFRAIGTTSKDYYHAHRIDVRVEAIHE
jgi:hypothetical protein